VRRPILVTGADGQLGRALRRAWPMATFTRRRELDICDAAAVELAVAGAGAVVNAAAMTAVDVAETPAGRQAAWWVNAGGVGILAAATSRRRIPLITVSTDYVFDGLAVRPIPVGGRLGPLNAYGASKAAGELAAAANPRHYIVRTSWLYGDGDNFVRSMLRAPAGRLRVVDDEVGRPTYAADLAAALGFLLRERPPYGAYHYTGDGAAVSRASLAEAILASAAGSRRPVERITSAALSRAAVRPAYSVLDLSSVRDVGITPPPWPEALRRYLAGEP
jgi:dTDP-4-dehydrorhamnose reductase